ncbi:sensor histidine kinase [Acuticoccus kandeliae]|uniref:sensor histidine kinase n=1 Tax=Acuticoccus kandeliae TaxID=2073160 RepID=UPI00147293F9|nr:DUF3369 domain-containing protein [Acuticoccus kandeliae]
MAVSPIDTDDPFIPILDDPSPEAEVRGPSWKVAIIDDDAAVHDGTRFALQHFRLNGRGLDFISAHSAASGRTLLREHPDVAVILLDVVMESDEAGLELVDYVRRELGNETVRIILRTGQPGHAPEQRVVVDYDINDYKAKTELTAEKLFTTMTAALRSFEQLQNLTRTRQGLEVIIGASAALHGARTVAQMGEAAIDQITRLTNSAPSGLLLSDVQVTGDISIVARSGRYRDVADLADLEARFPALARAVEDVLVERATLLIPNTCVALIPSSNRNVVLVFDIAGEIAAADCALLDVFFARLGSAFDNVTLYEALEEANTALERKVFERSAELTATNQRLEAQTAELRRVNALKNELLGIVAHELKNPLSVILGRAEILGEVLKRAGVDLPPATAQLGAIRASADRLTAIIDERLAEVRQDAPELTIRPRLFDFADLVRHGVDANRAAAERKGQTLDLTGADTLLVKADEDRIAEAVDNLLGNAVKYSPMGGTITVTLAHEGGEAVVRVEDSGPGIAAADRDRLFRPFQRLSATPTNGESSTGLGLYGAKRIVDLHGGRIGLLSTGPGGERAKGGSVFFLALALAADET